MDTAPDPDEIRSAEDLRLALVRLAGSRRKVRSIARDTGLAASSVSQLFAGKRRVTRRALVAVVDAYAPADHDRWVDAWARVEGRAANQEPAPHQLPSDLPAFVGRRSELSALDELAGLNQAVTTAPRVMAVVGTAGVGKTALAVHWGHHRQAHFPDGSLYVDLHGYDSRQPVPPGAALAALLRSLGVQDADQPADVEERAARYRSLLVDRRMLVVLDNARDSEHVRLLLPGRAPGITLVTARDGMDGLRYLMGAGRLELDVLSEEASVHLLGELLDDGLPSDRVAFDLVIERCAGLPLALRIAAGLAADRQGGLPAVADDLSDPRRRLDLLDAGDPRAAVRSVISWSFRTLDADVSRTFRLIGASPLPEVDPFLAAALAGISVAEARRHVKTLLRARLVLERRRGRIGMHDLLRDYAQEQAGDAERDAALTRLWVHYWQATDRAGRQLGGSALEAPPEPGDQSLPPLDRLDLAVSWIAAEHDGLMAVAAVAMDSEAGRRWIGRVADAGWRVLLAGGFHADAVRLHEVAVRTAHDRSRPDEEARAAEHLGISELMLGRYDDSVRHLLAAVELARAIGDHDTEARTLGSVGTAYARLGEHELAIRWMREGLEVAERIGAELIQARTHNNIGLVYQRWSRYDEAGAPLDRAVEAARRLGETQLLATALNNRSLVQRRRGHRGDMIKARTDIIEARALAEDIGDRILVGETLDSLGALLIEGGEPEAALAPLAQALAMHRETGELAAEAETLDNLGAALRQLGRPAEALARHEEALVISQAISDRNLTAHALLGAGSAHQQLGQRSAAKRRLISARELARELDNAEQEAQAVDGLARLEGRTG